MDNFEMQLWHKIFRRFSILLAIEAMLVTILPYFAGFYLSKNTGFSAPEVAGLWSAISGIIVLQVTIEETTSAAWLRILGSLVGAITSFIFLKWMNYGITTLAVTTIFTVIFTSLLKIKHTLRLACLTGQVIIIVGMVGHLPILMNCASRFAESLIGSLIALAVAGLFHPLRKTLQLTRK